MQSNKFHLGRVQAGRLGLLCLLGAAVVQPGCMGRLACPEYVKGADEVRENTSSELLRVVYASGGPAPEMAIFRVTKTGRLQYFSGLRDRWYCAEMTAEDFKDIQKIAQHVDFAAQLERWSVEDPYDHWHDQKALVVSWRGTNAFLVWEQLDGQLKKLSVVLDEICMREIGKRHCITQIFR